MKKIITMFITVLTVFYIITLFTACASTPPDKSTETLTEPAKNLAVPPTGQTAPPDTSPPEISVELVPLPYCPITPDGEEELLTVKINVKSASPIYAWHIELRESESNELFLSFEQEGEVPKTLLWNGRNIKGELVESATLYHFLLRVSNIYHNSIINEEGYIIPEDKRGEIAGQLVNGSTTYEGTLVIDIVVQREGKGILRIIVPSIIFAPNTGNLTRGLDKATRANNDRILRRIAEILNYFGTYKIKVAGHANPTFPPGSRQRASEESGTRRILGLQPLSRQRAQAVVEYLVRLGVARARLTPVGMGGKSVRVEFADRPNWWKNRRVEFLLEKP